MPELQKYIALSLQLETNRGGRRESFDRDLRSILKFVMLSRSTISLAQKTCLLRQCPFLSRSLSSVDVDQVADANSSGQVKMIRHTKKEMPVGKILPMNVHLAVIKVRENAWAKFDETVELSVNLGVDPRKPNQSIKVNCLFVVKRIYS